MEQAEKAKSNISVKLISGIFLVIFRFVLLLFCCLGSSFIPGQINIAKINRQLL